MEDSVNDRHPTQNQRALIQGALFPEEAMAEDAFNSVTCESNQLVVVCDPSFEPDVDIVIAHNDTLEFLRTIPDESVRLVVSSPPYNIGKPYEERTKLDRYLNCPGKSGGSKP